MTLKIKKTVISALRLKRNNLKIMNKYTADFETTTGPQFQRDGCVRVWAVNVTNIDTLKSEMTANNLDTFFEWCKTSDKAHSNKIIYFHNLKFDGRFIIDWLLSHNFRHLDDYEKPSENTFSTLITDTGVWYEIAIYFKTFKKRYNKIVIRDSLKKLPFSVTQIAKAFKLETQKLVIDYDEFREIDHELTDKELEYLLADTSIMAQALKIQFSQGLTKMTVASDALADFKTRLNGGFDYLFPILNNVADADIRRAYKGGYVYLKPEYAGKDLTNVISYDVNSLYPSVMYSTPDNPHLMPYGAPKMFNGEYVFDKTYPLFIQHFRACFKLKPKHLPTIQIKNNPRFIETEYLTDSDGEDIELFLTGVDLKLFLDHYDIIGKIDYINGFKFRGITELFNPYIDYWTKIKQENEGAMRQLAKLMLNSLYGKFGTNPRKRRSIPYMDEDGIVKFKLGEEKLEKPVYTALACYITAYARDVTIRTAQRLYDRFIYADTDSIHLIGLDEPSGIEIHPKKLGAWGYEGIATWARFIRTKLYVKEKDGVLHVTGAGMTPETKTLVTKENFHEGAVYTGKLRQSTVKGGALLTPTDFTIKTNKEV